MLDSYVAASYNRLELSQCFSVIIVASPVPSHLSSKREHTDRPHNLAANYCYPV